MNPVLRPLPSDWAEQCAILGPRQIRTHYRCGSATFTRWCKESGIRPCDMRFAPRTVVPDDFAQYGSVETTIDLARRYSTSTGTITRWRGVLGIPPTGRVGLHSADNVPADFAEVAPTLYISELAKHYTAAQRTVRKWLKATGVQSRAVSRAEIAQAGKEAKRERWKPDRKHTPSLIPQADVTLAGQAAQHLRRFYSPVYRAEILPEKERKNLPEKGKGLFVVGNKGTFDARGVIALAESRGFDPRGWARI